MIAIIYLSDDSINFSTSELEHLEKKAREHNAAIAVTGYFCYLSEQKRFIQYIEGEESNVQQLMNKIRADKRHQVVHAMQIDDISKRIFPLWNMQIVNEKEYSHTHQLESLIEQSLIDIKQKLPYQKYTTDLMWSYVNTISLYQNLEQEPPSILQVLYDKC